MKTINTYFSTEANLMTFVKAHDIDDSSALLIQVFTANNNAKFIAKLTRFFAQNFPLCALIGATTDGEIKDGHVSTGQTVISFSQFETTRLQTYISDDVSDYFVAGQALASNLIAKDTSLLICFIDGLSGNGEEFLNGIHSINESVMIAGGLAADGARFEKTYVFSKEAVYAKGVVGVALHSDSLHIINDYSFNWQPLGKPLTITKADKNRVYTIDDKTAVDTYVHYLGQDVHADFQKFALDFPFIIQRNELSIARACKGHYEDGSMLFAGNLAEGETVRFGCPNVENILNKTQFHLNMFAYEEIESIFIYSCAARRRFMPDDIEHETLGYNQLAPASGFYTYGEFFSTADSKALLNQTMTLVGLSESKIKTVRNYSHDEFNTNPTVLNALYHLIDVSSTELNDLNQALKQSEQIAHQRAEALAQNQQRMTTILDQTKVHFWVFDGDNYSYCNQQWFDFTGQNPEEPLTKEAWTSVVHPDDLASTSETWLHHWQTKTEHDNYCRLRRHDGVYRDFHGHAVPIFDERGVFLYFQGINIDITEQKQLENQIRQLAYYDSLTHLPNRRMLDDRLAQAIAASRRSGLYGALMFLDLDNFKPLNDQHGHEVGDLLLVEVAGRISSRVREMDTVARFGGDEFLVLLHSLDKDKPKAKAEAAMVAEKINQALSEPYLLTLSRQGQTEKRVVHYCTCSIGVVLFKSNEIVKDDILMRADLAMYRAKEDGRDLVRFYGD